MTAIVHPHTLVGPSDEPRRGRVVAEDAALSTRITSPGSKVGGG